MSEAAVLYRNNIGVTAVLVTAMGIRAASARQAIFGGSCWSANPELFNIERGVKMASFAWDAPVDMIHPDRSVNGLTTDQVSSWCGK